MSALRPSDLSRMALCAALLAALAACRAPSARVIAPDRSPPPPAAHELGIGSYDWHGLLVAPFGSVLKDIPMALHEVLLFREQARGGAAVDDAAGGAPECYAADAPALRFFGRAPDEFTLCFSQDRLSRIQASVRLPAADATDMFAAACAGWLQNAAPAATRTDAPGAAAPIPAAPGATACEGLDGAIHFSGRLEEEAERTEMPQAEPILSITLDGVLAP